MRIKHSRNACIRTCFEKFDNGWIFAIMVTEGCQAINCAAKSIGALRIAIDTENLGISAMH